jgi:hypothetical protein
MNILKKPGRILLMIMIVLAVVCPYRVHMYKTKIEEIKSGKLKINAVCSIGSSSIFSIFNGRTIYHY